MGSSRFPAFPVLLAGGTLILLSSLQAQGTFDEADFTSLARRVSVAGTLSQLPGGEFGTVTATIYPMIYQSESNDDQFLATVGLQWWVSPNLALAGGLGAGIAEQQVTQIRKVGLRYLPPTLQLGSLNPEVLFMQSMVEGSRVYTLKWNELRFVYSSVAKRLHYAFGIVLLYPRMFPQKEFRAEGVPGKLELSNSYWMMSAGFNLFWWLELSARVILGSKTIHGGAQLTVAI